MSSKQTEGDEMLATTPGRLPLPSLVAAQTWVAPPEAKPGAWAGAPTALVADGLIYLAYRPLRPAGGGRGGPHGEGRGYRNVVAVSTDGVGFEELCHVDREQFEADSLERPALVRTPEGTWRLYVSCATPGTKHWRVDLLEADTPEGLASATPRTVLPGSDTAGVKDPVIAHAAGGWHLWASVHPLESWEHADRMTTDYATSP